MKQLIAIAVLAAGCSQRTVDPCAGVAETCLAVQVDGVEGMIALDSVAVQVNGDGYQAKADPVGNGQVLTLPVAIGVLLPPLRRSPLPVRATVTGLRNSQAVAIGTASTTLESGQHQTVHVRLSGASAGILTIDPAPAYDYGTVNVGDSVVQAFTVTNQGTQPADGLLVTLSDPTDFTIQNNGCVGALAPGGICSLSVAFAPRLHGGKRVDLTASANSASVATVGLSGIGQDIVTLEVVRRGALSNNGLITAGGTVTIDPGGLSCGATCTLRLARGVDDPTATLTATPDGLVSQLTVGSWSGCSSSSGNSCTVTVSGSEQAPTTVTANFSLRQLTWSFVSDGLGGASGSLTYPGGTCASGSTCAAMINYGDTISYGAVPAAGSNAVLSGGTRLPWVFSGWSGTGPPCLGGTCNVASVTSEAKVIATFTPYNYMFVTSDRTIMPGGLGADDPLAQNNGFRGGDARCQALADASPVPGVKGKTYRAYLGRDTTPRVNALDRFFNATSQQQPQGWVRTDGRPFSDTVRTVNESSQAFSFPLVDEKGALITGAFTVATGANGNGEPEPGDSGCDGWSSPSVVETEGGDAGDGEQFFSRSGSISCGSPSYRLYCFGIDYVAPLSLPPPTVPYKRGFNSISYWAPVDGGSITDADNVCKQDAVASGLCSDVASCTFIAMLTPIVNTMQSRFTRQSLPIYRVDNVRVASSGTNFFAGILEAAFTTQPNLASAGGNLHWTGGIGTGSAATTCNAWSKTTGTGMVGQASDVSMRPPLTSSTTFFGSNGQLPCTAPHLLMCLER